MAEPTPKNEKVKFPPALLVVNAMAVIAIGLVIEERFPKSGHSLGLIRADLLWPVLGGAVLVAAFTTYKMIEIIRQHNRRDEDLP